MVLLLSSCASTPHYGNNGYGGGNSSHSNEIDVGKTAALVAAGVAGFSLYRYAREKDKRKKAERERDAYAHHSSYEPYYRGERRKHR